MPLKYEVREYLKKCIRLRETDKFITTLEKIKEDNPVLAREYISGEGDEGRCLLSWAAMKSGTGEIMRYLIDKCGANVNKADGKGQTPIFLAVEYGIISNVRYLIEKGADINNIKDELNGDTCFHIAVKQPNEGVIELLLAAGAKIEAKNKEGATVLHVAAQYDVKSLHYLYKYRSEKFLALLNVKDEEEDTPLHYAAMEESGQAAGYLLRLGADRTIKNKKEETPLQVADDWDYHGAAYQAIIGFSGRVQSAEEYYASLIGDSEYGETVGSGGGGGGGSGAGDMHLTGEAYHSAE